MTRYMALLICLFLPFGALAQEETPCLVSDKPCLLAEQEETIARIDRQNWKDQSYRELAKAYTREGLEDKAIALIPKISFGDTKAMTIRGIGFAAARGDTEWTPERLKSLWEKLDAQAKLIEDEPSRAIAWTYIAMAQAFAGDNAAAHATAAAMENDALRHKAFGETAEIQAERGDFDSAMKSVAAIDTLSFRNKAYRTIAEIFVEKDLPQAAYDTVQKIDNPYQRAEAIQLILDHGAENEDE